MSDALMRARLWPVMLGAFLAGLLIVGAAVLLPGGGTRTVPVAPAEGEQAAESEGAGEAESPVPALPVADPGDGPPPRIAIVVDDCGYDPPRDAEWLKFPEKITMAIIPFGPSSRRLAQSAQSRGFGVLISAPMEPDGKVSDRTDSFRLTRGMGGTEMGALLGRMIEENPWATGVSNHMGSAFTADSKSMARLSALLKSKGLFLFDSVTTSRTVAAAAARRAGVPFARRDVFLDAETGPEEMRLQWSKALAIAKEKGTVVLVCHGRRETLRTILDLLPDLEAQGIRAVTIDELLAPERSP